MSLSAARLDRYRRIANRARAIPGQHGLREHMAAVVVASTAGTYTGDGLRSETVTPLLEAGGQPPKIRWVSDEQLVVAGLNPGTVEIGPVTPRFAGGGTAAEILTGEALATGKLLLIRITGPQHPDGADYRIRKISLDRALHFTIQAEPVGSQA